MTMKKENSGEIVMYQPDETIRLEVRMGDDSVWLTQQQMAELFQTDRTSIVRHINNIYKSEELDKESTCAIIAQVQIEGNRTVKRSIPYFNLDMIISVGYRVNSKRGTKFRQWANQVPKDINTHFLRVDGEVYHIGASIKDLGKKWFAFTLMHDITPSMLAEHLSEKGSLTPPVQLSKSQQLTYNRYVIGVSGPSSGILCSPSVRCYFLYA